MSARIFTGVPDCLFAVVAVIGIGLNLLVNAANAGDARVHFRTHVHPILADKCVRCHGPDDATREADLRLDQEEGVRVAFAQGDFAKSEAWRRLTSHNDDERMPPPDSGKSVTADEIAVLKRWMEGGAPWTAHWAFVRPERQDAIARVEKAAEQDPRFRIRNEIDVFVRDRLQRDGLTSSPEADRTTLLRRLSFDLIGLPPTPREIDEYLADGSPEAYERVVDRLLASAHYGERMAVDWLDGARFADTNGYQNDFERTMWPWRDWVIDAFNANMPLDQFILEQLAGDLLPNATDAQKIATGFNRNHRTVTESGSIDEEWRVENVVDRTETTSGVFLGLTFGCARCHDHKYDPITQREFYQFYAFFNSVKEQGVYREAAGNMPPLMEAPSTEDLRRIAEMDLKIAAAEKLIKETDVDEVSEIKDWLQKEANRADSDSTKLPTPIIRLPGDRRAETQLTANEQSSSAAPNLSPREAQHLPGLAFVFTGTELLDLGERFQPERTQSFAVVAWIRPRPKDVNDVCAIVSKMDDRADYRGFDLLVQGNRKISTHLIHQWPGNAIKVVTKNSLPYDVWSHVALSYDGSSKAGGISIIVNGQPWAFDVEADKLSDTLKTDQPLRVGRRSTEKNYRGELADFRVYAREVTVSQAQAMLHDTLHVAMQRVDGFTEAERLDLDKLAAALPGTQQYEQGRALQELQQQRVEIKKSIPTVMIMEDLPTPRKTFLLKRGRYDAADKSEELQPNVPSFLPPLPEGAPRNRLTLARWIVAPENPLTARVMVNRVWQQMFGVGLVKTAENFGVQAEPPSHPELLDWLATELVRSGWNLKQLQRLIVTSATYRQTSVASADLYHRDPENRMLGHGPRLRLTAESIRDNALAVSGLLTTRIGGPSVLPYQPEGLWDDLAGGKRQAYVQDHGENLYRRSLYTYRKRTVAHPTLNTFDAPNWEVCALKRPLTNTPLQALALLNDVTYAEAARKLAERMIVEGGSSLADRARFGFRLATARFPTDAELATLLAGYERCLSEFRRVPAAAEKFLKIGEAPIAIEHNREELAAYATLASVLLNLDESIVKE